MENKITLNDLLKKITTLNEGTYSKDGMTIIVEESKKIDKNSRTCFKATVIDGDATYTFYIPFINDYRIKVEYKELEKEIDIAKGPSFLDNASVIFKDNNISYYLTKGYISSKEPDIYCYLHGNTLINKLSDSCSISYNFDDNKKYIYYKKYNTKNDSLVRDYIEINYPTKYDFASTIGNYNSLVYNFKNNIKKYIPIEEINDLIDTIKIPELYNNNIKEKFDELLHIAKLYQDNKDYLYIFEDQELLSDLYNFINLVEITQDDIYIDDLKNNVNNLDLKNVNNLRILQNKINNLIRLRKNSSKKKVLKNTDIEN